MVTSAEYRHVPTSRLAVLARRAETVFASASPWASLVRQHGWRRPRQRIHPHKPKVGLRTCRPDEAWHGDAPMLVVDGGVENFNGGVDELVESGVLRRVLAQTDVTFSNALIEAFWRSMRHNGLLLNALDSIADLRRHVSLCVEAHNTEVPHAAFRGATPDEVYFGEGEQVSADLAAAKGTAREARLEANRAVSCDRCQGRGAQVAA